MSRIKLNAQTDHKQEALTLVDQLAGQIRQISTQAPVIYDQPTFTKFCESFSISDDVNPISYIRQRSGLTQQQFAERYRIPKMTLAKWESNVSKPAPYTVLLLAYAVFTEYK